MILSSFYINGSWEIPRSSNLPWQPTSYQAAPRLRSRFMKIQCSSCISHWPSNTGSSSMNFWTQHKIWIWIWGCLELVDHRQEHVYIKKKKNLKKSKPEQFDINKGYYNVFPTTDLFLLHQRLFLIPKVLLSHCFTSAYIFFYCACFFTSWSF